MLGGGFDFFAEVGHVDAQVVRVFLVARTPDVAEELAVGDDLSAMLEQQTEECVFFDGEVNVRAGLGHGASREIDLHVAERCDAYLAGGLGAAEEDADAGEEFAAAEGFGEVVVGAGIQGGDLGGFVALDGEDEDGRVAPLAEAAEDVEAAHVGQAEVEDDGVGALDGGFVEAEGGVFGFAHPVTAGLKRDAEEAADLDLVVDDQYLDGSSGGGGRHGNFFL